MRAITDVRFFVLPAADFGRMMREWFPMAMHLLEGLFFGMRNSQAIVGQRERLLALGSLSAGLTHELNNPAAAAVRATAALRERVAGDAAQAGHARRRHRSTRRRWHALVELQEEVVERVAKAPTLTPMEASDREDELGDWLDDHGITGGWDLAPTLVARPALDVDWLDEAVDASCPEPRPRAGDPLARRTRSRPSC